MEVHYRYKELTLFLQMSVKGEKSSPVAIPEKLFTDCCSEQNGELSQLFDKLNRCNTVYEQMNCFGILKQNTCDNSGCMFIFSGRSIPRYLQICLLPVVTPRNSSITEKYQCVKYALVISQTIVTLYVKKDKESVVNIYSDLTELLLSNDFKLPYGSTNEGT